LTSALAAIALILFMPYIFSVGGYIYDYPELAFMSIVVLMVLKVDWWWIIPVVALGTWNKESFLLFIPTLYPLLRLRNSRLSARIGICVLALTCAAVYFSSRVHFAHNPGGTVEIHFADQLRYLMHPASPDNLESLNLKTYGLQMFRGFSLFLLLVIVWVSAHGWRKLAPAFKHHAIIAAVINVPLFILFCAPGELRDLSMLYVSFLMLLAANFTGITHTASA
jgi:hypothetical protein